MTKFLLVLAAAATAHANVIIDKGSVAVQSDRKSNLSHCNASAVTTRATLSDDVCTLSDVGAHSLVGSHVEDPQNMTWASAAAHASMPWLKFGSMAMACAGRPRALLLLLLSTSANGVGAPEDERWVTMASRRLDGLVKRLERGGGPYPGKEVVGKCLRLWDTSGKAYDFMKIENYDETSKKHKCVYIDGYEDGGRGSGESVSIDLSKNPDILPCKEEHVGLTIKVYKTACSDEYREGKILLYDEPTDQYVLRFPDGTKEGLVLEFGSIEFCDVQRDIEVCPYGADDPCEDVCGDCEMEEVDQTCSEEAPEDGDGVCTKEDDPDGSTKKDYKLSDVVEVLKNGRHYTGVVTKVRSDGCITVKYRKAPGLQKLTESGIELWRVRWPSDEDDSEAIAYKRGDRVEVLQEVDGDWLPGKLDKQRVTDGTWGVIYDDDDTETRVPESRIRRPEVEDEDPVDPLVDTCVLTETKELEATMKVLKAFNVVPDKDGFVHLMETVNKAMTIKLENHVTLSRETECFTNMRSAALTFMHWKRCTQWALTRCDTMSKPSFKPENKKALDDVALQLCSLYKSLGVTGFQGRIKGPYRDVSHATNRVRRGQLTSVKKGAGWHLGSDITCLMYKGSQMAVRLDYLDAWIPERFSCTFAKYSGTRTLALNWAEGFFGDEELCDACQFPRDAKVRNWHILRKPLPENSVMYVGVSGANYIKHALKRNSEGLNPPMFIGDVFDATGYDASDWSLKDIAPEGRRADADYWEKFVARHRVDAKLYEVLDDAGQIPLLAPRAKTPVFEWNQLKVALDVGDGLYRGVTDVAKGVEVASVVDKFFYGNAHTFEYMKKWDPSWKITEDFLRLADVASFDELTLAPLPTKTGYVIDEGGDGFHGLRWVPEGQIASSPGGGQRVKRKREERESREMRCYRNPDCQGKGEPFPIYCPASGVWRDDDFLESNNGPRCPACGRGQCQLV